MSNAAHTSPGSLRPGYTLLPDGRGRYVATKAISSGEELRTDLLLPWGSVLFTTERIDTTVARLAFLAELRLVDGQNAQQTQGGGAWVWVRIYETQSATGETQIGGAHLVNDANGREQIELTFRQFIAQTNGTPIPYVRGTKGSAAPGYANTSLASETMTDNGAYRLIVRRYDQTNATASTADPIGPVVVSYPFNQVGDAAHAVASQIYEQPAANYAPLTLNSSRSVTVGGSAQTLYYTGDLVPPGRQGATLLRFTRQWANKPGNRSEFGTVAASFPGLRRTQAELNAALAGYLFGFIPQTVSQLRTGFSQVVPCRIDYEYFRIAPSGGDYTSAGDIPLVAVQDYVAQEVWGGRQGPLSIFLSDADSVLNTETGFLWINLTTVPTRTAYFALGAFGLVVDCRVRRYMGPFYERRTVRVTPI